MYFSVLESLRLSTWRKGQPQLRLSSTNQWPNRASQTETAISSLLCHHAKPPIWSTHLPWAYTQNTLTPSATGLSRFEDTSVSISQDSPSPSTPSATMLMHLDREGAIQICCADSLRTPAPRNQPGQRVWLAAKDNPLKCLSQRLAPWAPTGLQAPLTILLVQKRQCVCVALSNTKCINRNLYFG